MSRIGKLPITLPQGVKAAVTNQLVKIEGPKGKLERQVHRNISVSLQDGKLVCERKDDSKPTRALHGSERALLHNMVVGVSEGFVKELDLIGVGYRADQKGTGLTLALGYSHEIDFELPVGVKGSVVKEGREITIRLESADRQQLGLVAANLRRLRSPEPYKGKGVRYKGEVIKLKAGKAGKK
jgi:large subunit ribosomal protein L6